MTMRAGRQSRNADFKNCGEAATTTLGQRARQTYEPSGPKGPVNPKNLSPLNLLNPLNPGAEGA